MTSTKIKMTHKEFVEAVMRAKAKAFNDKYDPIIKGFEVEIYVEPADDTDMNEVPDAVEDTDESLNESAFGAIKYYNRYYKMLKELEKNPNYKDTEEWKEISSDLKVDDIDDAIDIVNDELKYAEFDSKYGW